MTVAELTDDVDDSGVGDPVAVGEATTLDNACVDSGHEFACEPRLADTCIADERAQHARGPLDCARECTIEQPELIAPSDHWRAKMSRRSRAPLLELRHSVDAG